jgi:hypothetical protein
MFLLAGAKIYSFQDGLMEMLVINVRSYMDLLLHYMSQENAHPFYKDVEILDTSWVLVLDLSTFFEREMADEVRFFGEFWYVLCVRSCSGII